MTWPNVMVTRYMSETGQVTPEIDAKARAFVNEGYQLILTFESTTEPGGFNWWGNADPGNIVLTAAGMQMLADMSHILEVDRRVIERAHRWMESVQQADGSWSYQSQTHSDISNMTKDQVRATAYAVWSLADTGYTGAALDRGLQYLEQKIDAEEDIYTLGLIANALVSARPRSATVSALLDRLHDERQAEESLVHWSTTAGSAVGGHGINADVETTGLVSLAMIRAATYPADAQGAINWLGAQKDSFGQWGSTQATVLALRAMIASLGAGAEDADATVSVSVDGERIDTLEIDAFNQDVMHLVDLRELTGTGRHDIDIGFEGEGGLYYQVVQVHYEPWDAVDPGDDGPLSVEVRYDTDRVEVDGVVTGSVEVRNTDPALQDMVMVELGVPPGFDLDRTVLDRAVADGRLSKYETRPRLLVAYLMGVTPEEPVAFEYRLVARNPADVEVPRARVYSYYNPEIEAFSPPVRMIVE